MEKTQDVETDAPRTDPNTGMPEKPPTSYDTIRPDHSKLPGFAETVTPGQIQAPGAVTDTASPSNAAATPEACAPTRAAPPGVPAAAQAETNGPNALRM